MYDTSNSYKELEESDVDIAILPVGATEQHGTHAPLATDSIVAEAVSRGVAEKLNAYLLPTLPFGNSREHFGFRGTVSLEPWTLATAVKEIGLSLTESGFRWIVVISGHGGNFIIQTAIREINTLQSSGTAMLLYPWGPVLDRLPDICPDADVAMHAGSDETSIVMHLFPELVKAEREDFIAEFTGEFFDFLPMKAMSPCGVWGRPSEASAEKGRRVLELMIDGCAEHIRSTIATLKATLEGDEKA